MKIPGLPSPDSIQPMIDALIAKAPPAVRNRIAWVRYMPQDAPWPDGMTQTIVLADVSSNRDIRFAIKSQGFMTETLVEMIAGKF